MKIEPLDPFKTMICIAHKNNTFDKKQLREKKSEQVLTLNSGKSYIGNDSFFKVESSEAANDLEKSDWKKWYKACLNDDADTRVTTLGIPKLFSRDEQNRLGRLAEAILKRLD